MTILAAATGWDGTWIGSDGLGTVDGRVVQTDAEKWNVSPNGIWAFAGGGSWAFDFALRYDGSFQWPETVVGAEGVALLASAMRDRLLGLPSFRIDEQRSAPFGDFEWSPLVVGPGGGPWRPNCDLWTVGGPVEGAYQAAGAGQDFASGAMSALIAAGETSAETIVRAGINTACRMSVWCGGEIFIHRMPACRTVRHP
jgi:ATP-dependent protease HslVU (ClpYQ) peptidase subunit